MIGFSFILIYTLFENIFYKKGNKKENLNIEYSKIFFLVFIFLFLFEIIKNYYLNKDMDYSFLIDQRYYLYLFFELVGMFLLNLSYQKNKENFLIVNFSMFTTVLITPLLVLFLDPLLGFEKTIKTELFNNHFILISYIGIVFVLMISYFKDKIKIGVLKSPVIILITVISLLMSFYIDVKLLQTYQFNFLIPAIFEFGLSLLYLIVGFQKKEKMEFKFNIKESGLYFIYIIIFISGMTMISVELAVLFRRISLIISGIFLDKKKIKIKDLMIIISICGIGVFLVLY